MKRVTALLMTLALMALMALPAFAQGSGNLILIDLDEQNDSGISGTAAVEDQGDGTTRVDLVLEGVDAEGEYPAHIHAGQCPEVGDITYPLEPVVFNANAGAGVSVTIVDAPIDEILAEQSAINVHLYSDPSVYVACGNLPMAGGDKQDDAQDDQQDTGAGDDEQAPDNQQTGGGKDSGAGDDQQDDGTGAGDDQQDTGTGAGKTPDNQQGSGGATVTKTFELTLNGDVPSDRAFAVFYGTRDQFEGSVESEVEEPIFDYILFCGQPEDAEFADTVVSDDDCVGEGNTYSAEAELPQGTELYFSYVTAVETDLQNTADFFHGNISSFFETGEVSGEAEVLDTDMTNTAWYTFGKGTGAGDDQQDDAQDDGTGAGDDQQGEMPEELPETGAGGLAGTLPLGSAYAALALLAASGYGVIRRR